MSKDFVKQPVTKKVTDYCEKFLKHILEQFQKKDSKERDKQEELDINEDIDGDALERRMMRNLANERKTIKNWHKVLMRI